MRTYNARLVGWQNTHTHTYKHYLPARTAARTRHSHYLCAFRMSACNAAGSGREREWLLRSSKHAYYGTERHRTACACVCVYVYMFEMIAWACWRQWHAAWSLGGIGANPDRTGKISTYMLYERSAACQHFAKLRCSTTVSCCWNSVAVGWVLLCCPTIASIDAGKFSPTENPWPFGCIFPIKTTA